MAPRGPWTTVEYSLLCHLSRAPVWQPVPLLAQDILGQNDRHARATVREGLTRLAARGVVRHACNPDREQRKLHGYGVVYSIRDTAWPAAKQRADAWAARRSAAGLEIWLHDSSAAS